MSINYFNIRETFPIKEVKIKTEKILDIIKNVILIHMVNIKI